MQRIVRMLLVCMRSCPKSVLRYKFLIFGTCHLDTVFTWARMWGSLVIFRNQKGSASNEIWETPR